MQIENGRFCMADNKYIIIFYGRTKQWALVGSDGFKTSTFTLLLREFAICRTLVLSLPPPIQLCTFPCDFE